MSRSTSHSQSIQDRAFQHLVTSTLGDHVTKNLLETLQVLQLFPNLGNVLFGDGLHLCTCHASATGKAKERAHLIEREAQFTGAPNEDQALSVLV